MKLNDRILNRKTPRTTGSTPIKEQEPQINEESKYTLNGNDKYSIVNWD